jgi:twitching motility protein PilT
MLHPDRKAFISQREVGTDSPSHLSALQRSLRHDPDVIYLDSIEDPDVMALVLRAASARFVISTLPTVNTVQTVRRIIDFFPPHQEHQVRHMLGSVLQGVISQRLIDREDGRGRVAAFEFMVSTPRIHDAILESPGAQDLETLIQTGEYYGMQTVDQHLAQLFHSKTISMREALGSATHPQDLRVVLQGSTN